MIDVGGGYLDIPAVENGGFQDDRCRFKPVSIFVGSGQSFKLASSCYPLKINYLTNEFSENGPLSILTIFKGKITFSI